MISMLQSGKPSTHLWIHGWIPLAGTSSLHMPLHSPKVHSQESTLQCHKGLPGGTLHSEASLAGVTLICPMCPFTSGLSFATSQSHHHYNFSAGYQGKDLSSMFDADENPEPATQVLAQEPTLGHMAGCSPSVAHSGWLLVLFLFFSFFLPAASSVPQSFLQLAHTTSRQSGHGARLRRTLARASTRVHVCHTSLLFSFFPQLLCRTP